MPAARCQREGSEVTFTVAHTSRNMAARVIATMSKVVIIEARTVLIRPRRDRLLSNRITQDA
ncbi:MAG: hypothetical protein DMG40_08665 [Acidobacteria bacterium]|nr:MAG: hypothetical protein DMG40_08665 [Acidobacteriota bacterium]